MDFRKAFDSVDRSLMLCKLKVVGLPGKVIRAIWPIVRENFVQITTAECLSNSVTQNVGLAQGEWLSPLLYSIFTHDLPAVIEGQGGVLKPYCMRMIWPFALETYSKHTGYE